VISLRREIEASEQFAPRCQALLKAFLGLANLLPKAALPANPDLSDSCRQDLDRLSEPLHRDAPSPGEIDEAGRSALGHLTAICDANAAALEERDNALKEVVTTAAEAITSFKGRGENHNSNLAKLAEGFESLSHIENVNELRARLRDSAARLRECAEQMRRENEAAVLAFQNQVNTFQQRLDAARKDSALDRLTGLGSRREAERHLYKVSRDGNTKVLLFSVERFQEINERHGPLFGDKLLRAFAHLLIEQFGEESHAFRWSANEFLVTAVASLATNLERGRHICRTFAESKYYTAEAGPGVPLRAIVALGAVEWTRGQNPDEVLRRLREALEKDRKAIWK